MELKSNINYLFDTSVFIGHLRSKLIPIKLFQQVEDDKIAVGYSIITETELWAGIKPPRTVREHELLLKPFQLYSLNSAIARRAGNLRLLCASVRGQKVPGFADCLIAATAEYYNLRICSENTRDFTVFQQFSISSDMY